MALYLLLIAPINRTCIEICAGNGRESNTANLIINHGWWGHLFDGNEQAVKAGEAFFSQHKDTFLYPPRFTKAWITAENVNDQIAQSGARGPIDLLSLDIDGMDYILVGLRMRDPSAYKRAFDSYSQHDSTVETVRACRAGRTPRLAARRSSAARTGRQEGRRSDARVGRVAMGRSVSPFAWPYHLRGSRSRMP